MEEVRKVPPGVTLVALPYVSKSGFFGATVQSIVTGIFSGGFRMTKFLFIGDHTQVYARNMACEEAVKCGAEWLLFIDSDMDFPNDTLERLKRCDADIACADMWARGWPSFRTVMRRKGPDPKTGLHYCVPIEDTAHGIVEVDMCGMACTLIKTSLLVRMKEKFPEPWFWSGEHGEDATFCFKALELGATIKCDLGVVSGHWGTTRMAGQEYTRDAKNQPMAVTNEPMMARMGVVNLPASSGAK